jgi:hypothetical protein
MAGFSATDAALEGFRISRERPRALLAASIFAFAVSVLGVFIEVNMPPEAHAALAALQGQEPLESGPLLEAMTILSPLLLFGLLVQCMMAAAIYRILLRGETGSVRLFRVGPAEMRLMALALIYVVLFAFLMAAAVLFSALVAALASVLGQGAMVFAGTVSWVFSLGVVVWMGVRMSLAPVITFERNKLAIVDSWSVTRGQFWRLTGAYILAASCVVVVALLAVMVFLPVAGIVLLLSGGTLRDVGLILQPPEPTLEAYFQPLRVAYMALSSVFSALWYAAIAAPGAFAYRALMGREGA